MPRSNWSGPSHLQSGQSSCRCHTEQVIGEEDPWIRMAACCLSTELLRPAHCSQISSGSGRLSLKAWPHLACLAASSWATRSAFSAANECKGLGITRGKDQQQGRQFADQQAARSGAAGRGSDVSELCERPAHHLSFEVPKPVWLCIWWAQELRPKSASTVPAGAKQSSSGRTPWGFPNFRK